MNVAKWVVLAIVLCFGVVPVTAVLNYQFGGTYNDKVYPLDQAKVYIDTAQRGAVPTQSAPVVVDQYTSLAWAKVNESRSAAGVGNGSPCWLWPKPDQTYGYVNVLLAQTLVVTHNYSTAGIFNGTAFITWGTLVGNLLGAVGDAISGHHGSSGIASCLFFGNEVSTVGMFIDIGVFFVLLLLIFCLVVYYDRRETRRNQKQTSDALARRAAWLKAHPEAGDHHPNDNMSPETARMGYNNSRQYHDEETDTWYVLP